MCIPLVFGVVARAGGWFAAPATATTSNKRFTEHHKPFPGESVHAKPNKIARMWRNLFFGPSRMSSNEAKHFLCRRFYAKMDPGPLLSHQWQINRSNRFGAQRRPFQLLPTIRQRFTTKICYTIAHYFIRFHGWRPLHFIKVNSPRSRTVARPQPPITAHQSRTKICCVFAI